MENWREIMSQPGKLDTNTFLTLCVVKYVTINTYILRNTYLSLKRSLNDNSCKLVNWFRSISAFVMFCKQLIAWAGLLINVFLISYFKQQLRFNGPLSRTMFGMWTMKCCLGIILSSGYNFLKCVKCIGNSSVNSWSISSLGNGAWAVSLNLSSWRSSQCSSQFFVFPSDLLVVFSKVRHFSRKIKRLELRWRPTFWEFLNNAVI